MDPLSIVLNGLLFSSFYLLIASGLSLIFGIMHILNFAHGAFYMMGAFLCWSLYKVMGVNYWLVMLITIVAMAIGAFIIYWAVFGRPLRGVEAGRPIATLLISKGLALIITTAFIIGLGAIAKGVPSVIPGVLRLGSSYISYEKLAVVIISISLVGALVLFINNTRIGKSMKAVLQDREAALMCGINPWRTGAIAFIIGTVLAGVGGVLMAPILCGIEPAMGTPIVLTGLMIIIIAGIGSMNGLMAAAFTIGYTEAIVTALWNTTAATVAIYTIALLIFMLKPAGFSGHRPKIM